MNKHNLELLRSDLGDGGWSLHDVNGELLLDGPAEMIGYNWDRPNQADYDDAAARRAANTIAAIKIEGKAIQIDLSGGQGHRWTDVEGTDEQVALSDDLQEISCEIIDGKVDQHDDYVTQSGTHYRWR